MPYLRVSLRRNSVAARPPRKLRRLVIRVENIYFHKVARPHKNESRCAPTEAITENAFLRRKSLVTLKKLSTKSEWLKSGNSESRGQAKRTSSHFTISCSSPQPPRKSRATFPNANDRELFGAGEKYSQTPRRQVRSSHNRMHLARFRTVALDIQSSCPQNRVF